MPAGVRIGIQQRVTTLLPDQHIIALVIIRLRDLAEDRSIRRIQILRRQNVLNPPRRMQMLHPPTLECRAGDVNSGLDRIHRQFLGKARFWIHGRNDWHKEPVAVPFPLVSTAESLLLNS